MNRHGVVIDRNVSGVSVESGRGLPITALSRGVPGSPIACRKRSASMTILRRINCLTGS